MSELSKYAQKLRQYVANNTSGSSKANRLIRAEAYLDEHCPLWRSKQGEPNEH